MLAAVRAPTSAPRRVSAVLAAPTRGVAAAPARPAALTGALPLRRAAPSPRLTTTTSTIRGCPQPRPTTTIVPAAAAADGSVQGDMLEPSVFNKPSVRAAALAAAVALSAGTSFGGPAAATAAHVLAWATQFGTMVYTTFFAGILMFKNLPRQTFGRLQSHLFPAYFSIIAACLAVQGLTLWLSPFGIAQKQAINLGVGLVATLGNLLVAEPAATASMFKRYALENEGGSRNEAAITSLKKEFGKLHGISSLLNLAALVCCVAHGTWLAGLVSLPAGGAVLKLL